MSRLCALAAVAALHLVPMLPARAQDPVLSASDDPGPLVVSAAAAGLGPDPVSDSRSAYSVSVSRPGARITARLDAPLPAGVALTLTLQAPPGASSAGAVALDALERDLVVGIPVGNFSGLTVTYRLSATTAAGVVATATRSVTLTVRPAP